MQDRFSTPRDEARHDLPQDLLRAVSGRDANAQLPVVARTRRAIRVADETRREQGKVGRRDIGIALLTLGTLIVLVAPSLWNSVDDFVDGEHFGDLPLQIALISTLLMMSVVAALVLLWRSRSGNDEFRRNH